MKLLLILILSTITTCAQNATIKYECTLRTGHKTRLLYESIELRPDSTYSWMSEYDLAWEDKGIYTIDNDILTLNPPLFNNVPAVNEKPKKFLIVMDGLMMLDERGKPVRKIRDRSLGGFKSWLKGYKFKYDYNKVNKFLGRNN